MYNLVVFASGNGTTLQSIIDATLEEKLDANIALVVSNNPNAFALERAKKANIPTYVIKEKENDKIDKELYKVLSKIDINLIVLAGYLKLIRKKIIIKILNYKYSSFPTSEVWRKRYVWYECT